MGNQVTNATEALMKLNRKTGGIGYWLSDAEEEFINVACGVTALTPSVVISGPANITQINILADYKVPAGTIFDLIYAVDGVSKRAMRTYHKETNAGEAIARFTAEIEMEGGVRVSTDPGVLVTETNIFIDSGAVTNNLDSFAAYSLSPAAGVITTPAGTDITPAEATFSGYFKKGTSIDIGGTTNGVQPLWGLNIILEKDYDTIAEFVIAAAGYLSGNDGISFAASGDVLEALATFGSTACTIDDLVVV